MQLLEVIKYWARIASDFLTLLRIKQGAKWKRCHPKSDFRLWQATYFWTKNPINKLAINDRRLLIAAEFRFVHPVEKDSLKHHKLTQVRFSCYRKQVSRSCINFPHELTSQILINHSIKIGRGAWLTRDHGEKSQKQLSSLPVMAGWIFASEVSLKSNF